VNKTAFRFVTVTSAALVLACRPAVPAESDEAKAVLQSTGIKGGLVVHVGCGDGKLTACLRADDRYLVQGLTRDPKSVVQARRHLRELGVYGKVAVDHWRGERLPYTDNLVNLLVVSEGETVAENEILRVLAPRGVACVRKGGNWTRIVKPVPDTIGEWTHALCGPDNNAAANDATVGPPHHMQWVGGPKWARSHDHLASVTVAVSSGGRLFSIVDEGPIADVALPARWKLVACDAFNGVLLWKRPIPLWEGHLRDFRSGPSNIRRRLVAVEDRVFVTLGYGAPLTALDAATGAVLKTYEDTEGTEEIVCLGGVLYLVLGDAEHQRKSAAVLRRTGGLTHPGRRIVAVSAETGKVLWQKSDAATQHMMPLTLAVAGDRAFFHNSNDLVCLDAATGQEQWRTFRPLATRRPGWSTLTLVVHGDVVLCGDRGVKREVEAPGEPAQVTYLASRKGGDAPVGELIAYSVVDGKKLWSCKAREAYNAPVDVLVADGLVWSGVLVRSSEPGITEGRDPMTGQVKRKRPPDKKFFTVGMGHHRCHRNRGTSRFLVLGRAGVEFVDLKSGQASADHWIRGVCQYGVVPCNGLLYVPPHSCACYIQAKLNGYNALAPRRTPSSPAPGVERLERGPGYEAITDPESSIGNQQSAIDNPLDWPTYRHDAARSGCTKMPVPSKLETAWEAPLTSPVSSPVVAGGKVFVAEIDAHTVHALDVDSGQRLWSHTVGGRVDSPPTVCGGLVLFGAADGAVYCLRASDGERVWRYRAAPEERRIVAYGQLESPWPVHGSVLVRDGVVHAVAGRSSFLDGGMTLHRVEARTGKQLSVTALNSRDPKTGREPRKLVSGTNIRGGCLPDVLTCDGSSVFMRHVRFDLAGKRQGGGGRHLYVPAGFLDDTWWHRTYWMFSGGAMMGGYGGWPNAGGQAAAAGRLLVVNEEMICGFGRTAYATHGSHVGLKKTHYQLFAVNRKPASAATAATAGTGKGSYVRVVNTPSLNPAGKPLTVEAWVRADKPNGLVLARGASTHGYALALREGVPEFSIRLDRELVKVKADGKVSEEWTHLAGVLAKDKKLMVYVNVKPAGTARAPGLIAREPGYETTIGADAGGTVGDYPSGFPFTGLIDDVRVYHRALDAAEIAEHASAAEGFVPSRDGLVLCCGFEDGKATDTSGKKNHGEATGVKPEQGRRGRALAFAGEAPPPAKKKGQPGRRTRRKAYLWTRTVPLIARTIVLADRTLFVAGPPVPSGAKHPMALLDDTRAGVLLAVSTDAGGETISEYKLDAQPVFDGLAAAHGSLFVSLQDGRVVRLAAK